MPRIIPCAVIAGLVIVGELAISADCDPVGPVSFRQAEVEHLHRAVRAHLDVRWLEVAMDDPLFVRGFERLGDLLRDRQCVIERDRPLRDPVRQRRPLDQLHHEREVAVRLSRCRRSCAMFG